MQLKYIFCITFSEAQNNFWNCTTKIALVSQSLDSRKIIFHNSKSLKSGTKILVLDIDMITRLQSQYEYRTLI